VELTQDFPRKVAAEVTSFSRAQLFEGLCVPLLLQPKAPRTEQPQGPQPNLPTRSTPSLSIDQLFEDPTNSAVREVTPPQAIPAMMESREKPLMERKRIVRKLYTSVGVPEREWAWFTEWLEGVSPKGTSN
jgi:hypothetical protein